MDKIEAAIRSPQLEAFTLFIQPGRGWQMAVRRKGEAGWDIKIIPDEQAQAILSMLRASGHPDGPLTVAPAGGVQAALRDAESAVKGLAAAVAAWTRS